VLALIRMHCFPLPCGLACHPVPGILYWPQWSFKLRTAMQLYYPMFHGNPTPCGTSPAHCRLPLSHHRLSIHLLSVYRDAYRCTSLAVYLFPYVHVRRHCWSPIGFGGVCARPNPGCSLAGVGRVHSPPTPVQLRLSRSLSCRPHLSSPGHGA
jgi:hypothetical protein